MTEDSEHLARNIAAGLGKNANDEEEKKANTNIVTCTVATFQEANEVMSILKCCTTKLSDFDREASAERMTEILDQYQEMPQLLDPHLDGIVATILTTVMDKQCPPLALHQGFKYLYLFTKVRGHKYLSRLLPHEVSDVEPVLTLLTQQNLSHHETWETRYCLLLWLSVVCMIPFDLARLDGMIDSSSEEPIVIRILNIGKAYLLVPEKSRDAASLLLAKFLTRPDVISNHLPRFLAWCVEEYQGCNDFTVEGMTSRTGLLQTMAAIFKKGKRDDLYDCAAQLTRDMVFKINVSELNNALLRKLAVKLIQRMGLTFLKPKVAAWRYQRGGRSLLENLKSEQSSTLEMKSENATVVDDDEEDYDIPGEIESIIEHLLTGLRDKDTIVRWSAAKGVGRVSSRLPKELADEVIESILQLFNYGENGFAWHGGCLALAEIGRRGLLLPQRLPEVVPIITRALVYDESKGSFTSGAHVRDAACFVCWSFARAYGPDVMVAHVNDIASALIVTTLFDREVNCRRAAAAAFQENVGRQGTFPHGIDILTTADYFAVGNLKHCYLQLSVYVAQFEEYTHTLIDHLVNMKLHHWDLGPLAPKALYVLTEKAPKYLAKKALPSLMKKTTSLEFFTRQGSILGISEIVLGLSEYCRRENANLTEDYLSYAFVEDLKCVVQKVRAAKQLRGHGGEWMRKAVCVFIQNLSQAQMPFENTPVLDGWRLVIDDCLCNTDPNIQEVASLALSALAKQYYRDANGVLIEKAQDALVQKYTGLLHSQSEFERLGYAMALGHVPQFMLEGVLDKVIESLLLASKVQGANAGIYAESRREALKSVTRICTSGIEIKTDGDDRRHLTATLVHAIYDGYFTASKDYTTDNRGDVGSWVREAAMSGLESLSMLLLDKAPHLFTKERCVALVQCVMQQAAEKIDRTRVLAGGILLRLIHSKCDLPIPHLDELKQLFSQSTCDELNWAAPPDVFAIVVQLLKYEAYRYPVFLGLAVSVGGITESLVKCSSEQLKQYVASIEESETDILLLASTIIQIFSDNAKNDRIIIPLMKTTELLLSTNMFDLFIGMEGIEFPIQLLDTVKAEISKCGDAKKLIASIAVFCGLVRFHGKCQRRALTQLMILLCHRFPRVRNEVAEQAYTALLIAEEIVEESTLDEILYILSETGWDVDVSYLRNERNKVCDLLQIARPQLKSGAGRGKGQQTVDQLDSYRDLVGRLES